MERDKEIEIVVVGLSNYISRDKAECDRWARSLTPGTMVLLEWEPENPYTPGRAFKAYVGDRMVGRAAKDHCHKLLCLKDEEGLVEARLLYGRDKELHVTITVPEGVVVPESLDEAQVALLTDGGVFPQGLNLPLTEAESRLKRTLRLLRTAPTAELITLWHADLQRTLSHEALSSIAPLCQQLFALYPTQTTTVREWEKDMGKGPDIAYTLWQNLITDLQQVALTYGMHQRWACFFFGDNAPAPTLSQLYDARSKLEAWLDRLPHAIWRIYHQNVPIWAQMLKYQQPKREILYQICTHWMALDWVNSLIISVEQKQEEDSSAVIESESESKKLVLNGRPVTERPMPKEPLTDPDRIFIPCYGLEKIYRGIDRATYLMTSDGDWGLLALALSEEMGRQIIRTARVPHKALAALLVRWGFIPADREMRICNSMKRRSADYNNDLGKNLHAIRWTQVIEDMMKCFD